MSSSVWKRLEQQILDYSLAEETSQNISECTYVNTKHNLFISLIWNLKTKQNNITMIPWDKYREI